MLGKSRIIRVKLVDGKTLHYPSDMELKQLWDEIESITYEQIMTKAEWESKFVMVRVG